MRLILMRHGKSAYPGGVRDHDRPLAERGRRSAALMGGWLTENGWTPDVALVSSAARAQETWESAGIDAPMRTVAGLYLAPPDVLLKAARAEGEGTVMLVAHNPGLAVLANEIVHERPDHPRFMDFPTCATLVVEEGEVLGFAVPRDLAD